MRPPAAWALQRLKSTVPAELQPAAGGLRTVVLQPKHFNQLPELAQALRQHPRVRFVVIANAPRAYTPYLAAMMAGGCCKCCQ